MKYASPTLKRKNKKAKAEKKIQIAIDKLVDIVDLQLHYSVSEFAGEVLDKLRELETKIQSS